MRDNLADLCGEVLCLDEQNIFSNPILCIFWIAILDGQLNNYIGFLTLSASCLSFSDSGSAKL